MALSEQENRNGLPQTVTGKLEAQNIVLTSLDLSQLKARKNRINRGFHLLWSYVSETCKELQCMKKERYFVLF